MQSRKFPAPFTEILPSAKQGGALLMRLHATGAKWLRVHADGVIELSRGTARSDQSVRWIGALGRDSDLYRVALELHQELLTNLIGDDLQMRPQWGSYYTVQAFSAVDKPIIEGYIGLEIEMGALCDVFGFRDNHKGHQTVLALRALLGRFL